MDVIGKWRESWAEAKRKAPERRDLHRSVLLLALALVAIANLALFAGLAVIAPTPIALLSAGIGLSFAVGAQIAALAAGVYAFAAYSQVVKRSWRRLRPDVQ